MSEEKQAPFEAAVIEQLTNYRRIVARMLVLGNYSVGAGITVSTIRQDDHLQELHRKLRGLASYMYLTRHEQELETTAHAYLSSYPSGSRAQLKAIPMYGADAEDDKALKDIRRKIEKVIESRTGSKDGFEAVIERISELQDLEAQKSQIDATLLALESYKPDYAKLLRMRYIDDLSVNEIVDRLRVVRKTFDRWRPKAIEEYARLSGLS